MSLCGALVYADCFAAYGEGGRINVLATGSDGSWPSSSLVALPCPERADRAVAFAFGDKHRILRLGAKSSGLGGVAGSRSPRSMRGGRCIEDAAEVMESADFALTMLARADCSSRAREASAQRGQDRSVRLK